jgi:hypothetical protein
VAKRFKAGDIFALELPTGEYVTGRVLLDVKHQCIRPKLLLSDSPLSFFNGAVLTEIYKQSFPEPTTERSEILISGIWTDSGSFKRGRWNIIGYEALGMTRQNRDFSNARKILNIMRARKKEILGEL